MKLVIDFSDEVMGATVVSETSSGAIEEKPVSMEDVEALFASNVSSDTGYLPSNPKVQIIRHMKVEGETVVCVVVPPHVRDIPVDNRRFPDLQTLKLPIPHFMMWIRYNTNGSIIDTRAGCTEFFPVISDNETSFTGDTSVTCAMARRRENPRTTDDVRIYQFPYGNIFSHDHNICWGNCQLPQITDITRDVIKVIDLFFSAAVNGDLFASPNGMDFQEFLLYMADKTELSHEDYAATDLRVRHLRERIVNRRRR